LKIRLNYFFSRQIFLLIFGQGNFGGKKIYFAKKVIRKIYNFNPIVAEEKRAARYSFGLGKRRYDFGLGKRKFEDELNKRLPNRYNFGLGR
jgi:hypothetical protein